MIHKLRRFAALEPEARSCLLRSIWTAILVRVSFRLRGYARTRQSLASRLSDGEKRLVPERESEIVELHSWAIRTTGEQVPGATCLVRSVALWWLLARHGIDSEIHFGVTKDAIDLEAHAWLEWNGRPLTDTEDPRERFTTLEGSPPT
jgi:hypothetical protein